MHPESILCADKYGEEGKKYLVSYAVVQEKSNLLKRLLRANVDLRRPTWSRKRNILFFSHHQRCTSMLLWYGASVLLRDSFGKTALHHAISRDRQHILRSSPRDYFHLPLEDWMLKNVQILVEAGADVDAVDSAGVTPLLTLFKTPVPAYSGDEPRF